MMHERAVSRFAAGQKRVVMEGVATPADKAVSPYLYLPFVVPEGTESVTVRYSYDASGILDIGLVDPEIEPFPARQGFRGWSGSARRELYVSRETATPGYMAGPVQPGLWRVILGLHQVPAQGCRYQVEVVLDEPLAEHSAGRAAGSRAASNAASAEPSAASAEPSAASAEPSLEASLAEFRRRTGRHWRRGDLHAHTFHSDAKGSPEELVALARARGLEFLAITDHNTASQHRVLDGLQRPDFLVIRGEEITTDLGHANVWGVDGWVDFRLHGDDDVELLVREAHARGGVISVNHPKRGGPPWRYAIPDGVDCLEAWQMLWPMNNREALELYDRLLRAGRRVTLVGGSDWHQPAAVDERLDSAWAEASQVGNPTTWLELPALTETGALEALRRGAAFVSEAPAGPMIDVRVGDAGMGGVVGVRPGENPWVEGLVVGARGDRLRWVGSCGVLREAEIAGDVFTDRWELREETLYVRAEVVRRFADTGPAATLERVRALSNPVYLERTGG